MATVGRFEELEVWQAARTLTNLIYDLTDQPPFTHDHGLKDQIRRAAVSVMSNIAEGFERGSDTEFRNFLVIAKGSAGEVRAQLYVAMDRGYMQSADFSKARETCEQISRLLLRLIAYLRNSIDAAKPSKHFRPPRPSEPS